MEIEFYEEFSLYFGTDTNKISSKALASALSSLNTAIDGINFSLNTGKNVEFFVKPFEHGSFNVPGEIIQFAASVAALTIPNYSHIPDILTIFGNLVSLKNTLSGEKIKKIDEQNVDGNVEIQTENGNVVYVDNRTFNVYKNNTIVSSAIDEGIIGIREAGEVKTVEFKRGVARLAILARDDLQKYEPVPFSNPGQKDVVKTENVTLNIFKVVFDKTRKWEFIYNGNKISAKITDDQFHQKVAQGERFAQGDSLLVELFIKRSFDEATNTYINRMYEIKRVFKHIPRSEQLGLVTI